MAPNRIGTSVTTVRIGRRPAIMYLAAQARSSISLTGLVQHLAEVERN